MAWNDLSFYNLDIYEEEFLCLFINKSATKEVAYKSLLEARF